MEHDLEPKNTCEPPSERANLPSSSSLSGRLQSPEAESDQVVYMVLSLSSGPICHSLYAITLPELGVPLVDNNIYPVCELPRPDYPEMMCCQKLGSKLFLLGGFRWETDDDDDDEYPYREMFYPEKVYCIDTSTLSLSSGTIDHRTLVTESTSMGSGKPNCRAFVIGEFLYAISLAGITKFERFDNSGHWFKLPDPPIRSYIISDAVVKSKLILGTEHGDVHCFDLNNLMWTTVDTDIAGLSFRGHSTVLDDFLYSFTFGTLFAFGPTTDEDITNKKVDLFKKAAHVSMPLYDTISDHLPIRSSAYLDHWGKCLFCLGTVGSLLVEEGGSMFSKDTEKGQMSIIIFEVTKQTFLPPTEANGVPTFEANLLHSERYLFRSRNGTSVGLPFLLGCFSNYTEQGWSSWVAEYYREEANSPTNEPESLDESSQVKSCAESDSI